MKYTAAEISEITNSQIIGNKDAIVEKILFDSRNIYSVFNTAFIAIKTKKNNGEKYIQSAIEKGIKIIISENQPFNDDRITWILVKNTMDFLRDIAKYHLKKNPLKTIGITGSNGKTTVKEWLYQSLYEDFNIVKSPKSFNSKIGLPLSILKINETHNLGIFEFGISQPNEMSYLENILSPTIGILTHIGTAHIANFKNEEELIDEKISLFKNSEIIIFNGDNPFVFNKIKQIYADKKLISYGFESHNDVRISSDWQNRFNHIEVTCFDKKISFPAQQRDKGTLTNALAIISVLNLFGFSEKEIENKINHLKSVEMRLESVHGLRNNLIINDSYNLDLDSLKVSYQFIQEYNKKNKSLVITDFAEKKEAKTLYQEVVKLTNEQNFHQIFLIGKEITEYKDFFEAQTFTFRNTDEVIRSVDFNRLENEIILLKGARKFEIERLKTHLELQKHDTVLEVNLNKILHNINIHKNQLKPETKIMAMVKAFSYGLGGYEIAEFLQHHHIDYLGVAVADEGVDLRKNGITTPIIVMNPEQHSYDSIIEFGLEPNIYSFRVLELFDKALKQENINRKYPIHLKIETGMHRLGFKENEIEELIERLKNMNVKVMSIFSHLSSADIPNEKDYTEYQFNQFEKISNKIINQLGYQPIRHILNSSGITNYPEHQYEMVRIGIGMIGISYNPEIKKLLQPAVTFKTIISQISTIDEGESVGYGRNFKAEKLTRIATIPVGYADGIPRLVGKEKGKVSINGQLYPIVGNVCMDMMMVKIDNSAIKEGDEVIIFNSTPSLEEFAEDCQTIPYEVLTSISRRVKRIYIKD